MGTEGRPIATHSKAMETNTVKDDGETKKTMGGSRALWKQKPKKPMVTQGIGNKPKERRWKNKESNGMSKENYGGYPEETNGHPKETN